MANYYPERTDEIKHYYIQTRGQDVDPCEFEEIKESNGNAISVDLINFFMEKAFPTSSNGRFYLILADSGMGKTTFLLTLYRKYMRHITFKEKKDMKFVSLSESTCLRQIEEISNKKNVILLLDAFDEAGVKDSEHFMDELLVICEPFYRVVITCRTQYFISEDKEPYRTQMISRGIGEKTVVISKKYISPFSDEDVNQYLNKRFKDDKKKKQAKYIIDQVPSLAARPLILNWIEDLCSEENVSYSSLGDIYCKIVRSWLNREPQKLILNRAGDITRENAYDKLYLFSIKVARFMMCNNNPFISTDDIKAIAEEEDVNLSEFTARTRSLLNRNAAGLYKFAHKSFLEYFIAQVYCQYFEEWMQDSFSEFTSETKRFIYDYKFRNIQENDLIPFGTYCGFGEKIEQSIIWRVLLVQNTKILLMSEFALDTKEDWEQQKERLLLSIFSSEELAMIGIGRGSSGDKIFLMTRTAYLNFQKHHYNMACQPTPHAALNGVITNNQGECEWWLRTLAKEGKQFAVTYDGKLKKVNRKTKGIGMRPLIWVDLSI